MRVLINNRLDELADLTESINQFGHRHDLPVAMVEQLQLVCEELVVNTIRYGYNDQLPHLITIEFDRQNDGIRIVIEDDGRPFSPLETSTPDTDAPLEQRAIGGLGIHLVRIYMDNLEYERVEALNRVTLFKKYQPAT